MSGTAFVSDIPLLAFRLVCLAIGTKFGSEVHAYFIEEWTKDKVDERYLCCCLARIKTKSTCCLARYLLPATDSRPMPRWSLLGQVSHLTPLLKFSHYPSTALQVTSCVSSQRRRPPSCLPMSRLGAPKRVWALNQFLAPPSILSFVYTPSTNIPSFPDLDSGLGSTFNPVITAQSTPRYIHLSCNLCGLLCQGQVFISP